MMHNFFSCSNHYLIINVTQGSSHRACKSCNKQTNQISKILSFALDLFISLKFVKMSNSPVIIHY